MPNGCLRPPIISLVGKHPIEVTKNVILFSSAQSQMVNLVLFLENPLENVPIKLKVPFFPKTLTKKNLNIGKSLKK